MSVEPERTFPRSGTTKQTAVSRPLYAAKISRKYGASFQLQSEWFALIIAERQPLGKIFAKIVSGVRESPDPGKRNALRQESLGHFPLQRLQAQDTIGAENTMKLNIPDVCRTERQRTAAYLGHASEAFAEAVNENRWNIWHRV